MKDLVVLKGQKAVTTSLRVADVFRKRHDNVLEAIRGLLKNKGTQQMFEESSYINPLAIGKWANKLGVKRDADMSYRDHDGAWRYFPEALKVFQDNALEIQDDDLGL